MLKRFGLTINVLLDVEKVASLFNLIHNQPNKIMFYGNFLMKTKRTGYYENFASKTYDGIAQSSPTLGLRSEIKKLETYHIAVKTNKRRFCETQRLRS